MSSISIVLFALLVFALEWLVIRAPIWLRQRARRSVLPLAVIFAVLALPGCDLLPPSPAPLPDLSQAQGEAVAAIALASLRTDEEPRPEPLPPAPPPPSDDFGRGQHPSVLPPAPVEVPLPESVAYPEYADPAAASCGPGGCAPARRGLFGRWRARRR